MVTASTRDLASGVTLKPDADATVACTRRSTLSTMPATRPRRCRGPPAARGCRRRARSAPGGASRTSGRTVAAPGCPHGGFATSANPRATQARAPAFSDAFGADVPPHAFTFCDASASESSANWNPPSGLRRGTACWPRPDARPKARRRRAHLPRHRRWRRLHRVAGARERRCVARRPSRGQMAQPRSTEAIRKTRQPASTSVAPAQMDSTVEIRCLSAASSRSVVVCKTVYRLSATRHGTFIAQCAPLNHVVRPRRQRHRAPSCCQDGRERPDAEHGAGPRAVPLVRRRTHPCLISATDALAPIAFP